MPIESAGGFIFQNPNISDQSKADFTTLMNSNTSADSTQDQQAIFDLMTAPDRISRTAGLVLQSNTFSAQGIHDLIYALDHDSNTTSGTSNKGADQSAFTEAIGDLQTDPNLNNTDKQNFNTELQNYILSDNHPHGGQGKPPNGGHQGGG